MQRSLALLLGCTLAVVVTGTMPHRLTAQAAAGNPPRPEVVAAATGEAQLTPDRAAVYIGVQTRASKANAAARDNAQRQRAIIDAVLALGIPREQISTESYSVSPDTRYDQATQRTSVIGYVVSNVVRVEVHQLDQIGTVLDTALAKGANQINSLDFFASNADSARHEALAQAVSRARSDAEAMARAAGGTLGPLLELGTADTGPRPVYRMQVATAELRVAAPTPIEPGQQRVQVSVTAKWQFMPR
jgi:hypothetical protein